MPLLVGFIVVSRLWIWAREVARGNCFETRGRMYVPWLEKWVGEITASRVGLSSRFVGRTGPWSRDRVLRCVGAWQERSGGSSSFFW